MNKLVFLLEEASMKEFLERFLPRLLPEFTVGRDFLCIRHEGKQDLVKSIPRKLRAWAAECFVIVHDNDGAPCQELKARLQQLCREAGRPDALVRLACQELEAWYLGALEALAVAYAHPELPALGGKRKFRDPDKLISPSQELRQLVPTFRKIEGARRMGECMPLDETQNRSRSFQVFVAGIRRLGRKTSAPTDSADNMERESTHGHHQ